MTLLALQSVHMGEPALRPCAAGGLAEVYPVYALAPTGVTQIAAIVTCDCCPATWRCLINSCVAVLPADGTTAHQHVLEVHGA